MKQLVCLCSVMCIYAKLANITTSFLSFPEETVVPVVWNSTQGNNHSKYPLSLNVNISRYILHLSLNEMMIPPSFSSIYFDSNDQLVEETGFTNCYYQGKVKPFEYNGTTFQNWNAGVSICDGIEGQFGNIEDGYVIISPSHRGNNTIEQDHLLTYMAPSAEPNLNETVMKNDFIRVFKNTSRHTLAYQRRQNLPSGFFIIEVVLVNDNELYVGLGRDVNRVVARSIQLMNLVDMLYFSIGINVVLVRVITWSNGNQITYPSTNRIDQSLMEFTKYLRNQPQLHFDLALLISGKTFRDNSLGVAYVPGICDGPEFEGVVIGSGLRTVDKVSITTAHEMGHTLGMNHDDEERKSKECVCNDPTGFCIMEATLFNGVGLYSQWSSCSVANFERPVATLDCMVNNPMVVLTDPVCGNGVVEGSEECDCNSPENCAQFSACCDMSTCKFYNTSTLCRPANSSCDIDDYCTGSSSSCPNTYIADGQPCSQNGDQSFFCLKALCVSLHDQCKLIYGPSSIRGADECFNQNRQGTRQGHCGFEFSGRYSPCSSSNDMCGLLHCEGGLFLRDRPATIVTNDYFVTDSSGNRRSCQSVSDSGTFPDDSVLVSEGSPCGTFQICSRVSQRPICLLAFSLRTPCAPNSQGLVCSGLGRCTDSGHCSCYGDHFGDRCEKLNECLTDQNNCGQNCLDQLTGFTCSCRDGYELDSNNRTCTDINECMINNGSCEVTCVNLPGTYSCQCQEGYFQRIQDSRCRKLIDECAVNNGGCQHLCTDTLASFLCSCPVGFQLAMDNRSCEDIDECNSTSIECDQCTNNIGSFICSCDRGFEFNGQRCQEINYCSRINHTCHSCASAGVLNITCTCRSGYSVGSDQVSCQDINECDTNNGGCSSLCVNSPGSYQCGCERGYQLTSNRSCEDINECGLGTHACAHLCANRNGGFQCYCSPGHMLRSDGVTCSECPLQAGGKCEQTCDFSGKCTCYEHFVLNQDGRTCKSGALSSSLENLFWYYKSRRLTGSLFCTQKVHSGDINRDISQ